MNSANICASSFGALASTRQLVSMSYGLGMSAPTWVMATAYLSGFGIAERT
jgi:hypothetical protein